MEILEKLLESGATVDFQDRVCQRAGMDGYVKGGGGCNTERPSFPTNLEHREATPSAGSCLCWAVWPQSSPAPPARGLCPSAVPLSWVFTCHWSWRTWPPGALSALQSTAKPHPSLPAGLHGHALGLPRGPPGGGKTAAESRSRQQREG